MQGKSPVCQLTAFCERIMLSEISNFGFYDLAIDIFILLLCHHGTAFIELHPWVASANAVDSRMVLVFASLSTLPKHHECYVLVMQL